MIGPRAAVVSERTCPPDHLDAVHDGWTKRKRSLFLRPGS